MSTITPTTARRRGPRFKLTPAQALEAREAHRGNESSVDEIARRYGVTKQTIYNVLRRLREQETA